MLTVPHWMSLVNVRFIAALSTRRQMAHSLAVAILLASLDSQCTAQQPVQGEVKQVPLGKEIHMEVLYLPPGEFLMGSTAEERAWATGIEGGATPGTDRESYEGDARPVRIKQGLWMGRTEVSVGQFRRFVEETGYVTDAEKPGGKTQCFDPEWTGYKLTTSVVHPWEPMPGKSWKDPNWAFPAQDHFPVVCVSWNDGRAFCHWLTERERTAGRLGKDLEYRLPTDGNTPVGAASLADISGGGMNWKTEKAD